MIRAGRLRHRVTVQRPVTSRDSYGQDVITWTSAGDVWAAVEPLRGREYFDADQHTGEITTRVIIRWRSDFDTLGFDSTWRIVFGSRTLIIIVPPIDKDYLGRSWELMCRDLT